MRGKKVKVYPLFIYLLFTTELLVPNHLHQSHAVQGACCRPMMLCLSACQLVATGYT